MTAWHDMLTLNAKACRICGTTIRATGATNLAAYRLNLRAAFKNHIETAHAEQMTNIRWTEA